MENEIIKKIKEEALIEGVISFCPHCFCMTKTIEEGKCGKCKEVKYK